MHRTRLGRLAAAAVASALVLVGLVAAPAQATTAITGHIDLGPAGATSRPAGAGEVVVHYSKGLEPGVDAGTVTTDGSGDFTVPSTPNPWVSLYYEYVGSGGFQSRWNNQPSSDTAPRNTGMVGSNSSPVSVRLLPLVTVSGTFSLGADRLATPGEGEVRYRQLVDNVWTSWSAPYAVDGGGRYSISGLHDGYLQLKVDYLGTGAYIPTYYADSSGGADPGIPLELTGKDVTRNVFVPAARSTTGRVFLGASDRPATAGEVQVTVAGGSIDHPTVQYPEFTTTTDADGRYSLPALPPRTNYAVFFHYLGTDPFRTVTPWGGVLGYSDVVHDVTIIPAVTVSGHVSIGDELHRVGAGQVVITIGPGTYQQPASRTVTTDAQGYYEIDDVPWDSFILNVHDTLGRAPDREYRGGSYASSKTLDVILGQLGHIYGNVSDGDSWHELSGVHVTLYRFDTDTDGDYRTYDATTDGNGTYRFDDLPTAVKFAYTIVFESDDPAYAPAYFQNANPYQQPDFLWGDEIGSAVSYTTHLYRAASIQGTVTGTRITPAEFAAGKVTAEVVVLDAETGKWTRTGDIYPVGADGNYEVSALYPDAYRLRFQYVGYGVTTATTTPTITVAEAETKTVNATVTGGTAITLKTRPVVSGAVRVGSTVKTSVGTYSPTPTKYVYAWLRDGVEIPGATSSSYAVTSADLGHTLASRVSAMRSGYATRVTASLPVVVGQGVLTAPVPKITGTSKVGSTLTAAPGTWTAGTSLAYQWYASNVAIPGADGSTLTLGTSLAGKKITVAVTGTKADYLTKKVTSLPTVAVATIPFVSAPAPLVSGTPQVGLPLTAAPGTWDPSATFTYQWYSNGIAITGARSQTFTPSGAQLGKRLTVRVTASSQGYTTQSKTSASTGIVAIGVLDPIVQPVVSGTPQVGAVLSADTSGWQPGIAFAYQWYANGAAISKATAKTFVVTATQLGTSITVRIVTSTSGYPRVSQTSSLTAPVIAGEFSAAPIPTVVGTLHPGSTVKAVPGTWSPAATLTYQWLRNGAPIAHATATTYKITSADAGAALSLRVTAKRAGFTTTTRESTPGAVS